MLFETKYKKNLKRFMFYIDEVVDKANEKYSTPDCYPYIRELIQHKIDMSHSQIESWTSSTDVQSLAYKILYNVSFDALCSGQLHIYRGALDPLLPGDKLFFIVKTCLDYYIKHGYASDDDAKDQLAYLDERIATVG